MTQQSGSSRPVALGQKEWRARRVVLAVIAVVCALAIGGGTALAAFQQPQGQPPGRPQESRPGRSGPRGPMVSPGEVQQLFDAYLLMQAQRALGLSDAQYPQFLIKMKALLELRRKNSIQRFEIIRRLRDMTRPNAQATDTAIKDELEKLRAFDASAAVAMQKAYAAVDQGLDVRQQARLRVFEQQMERRKLELLMRARGMRRPDFRP